MRLLPSRDEMYGLVGWAGKGTAQHHFWNKGYTSTHLNRGLVLLEPRPEHQRAMRVSHLQSCGSNLIVFGDQRSCFAQRYPSRQFESIEQAIHWIAVTYARFCGVWHKDNVLQLFVDHAASCPLYYSLSTAGRLRFGCRIQDLMAAGVKVRPKSFGGKRPLPELGQTAFVGIEEVPPGHIAAFEIAEDGTAHRRGIDQYFALPPNAEITDENEAVRVIVDALHASVSDSIGDATEIAVSLSGGVDSAAVASLARPLVRDIYSYTVGTPYGNEFIEARTAAAYVRAKHQEIEMSIEDAKQLLPEVIEALETWDPQTLQVALPVCFLYKKLQGRHPLFLTGYGCDLIFAGAVGTSLSGAEVDSVVRSEVMKTAMTGELVPVYADRHGVAVRYPLWTSRMLRDGVRISGQLKIKNQIEKYVFRRAMLGFLPEAIAWRKKLAIHEGAGIPTLMSDLLGTPDPRLQNERLREMAIRIIGAAAVEQEDAMLSMAGV